MTHASSPDARLFRPVDALARSSRFALTHAGEAKISLTEVALLLTAGGLATAGVAMVGFRLGIPGHAILRAVPPIALGFALVPRRMAGMIMASGVGVTSASLSALHIGFFPQAALISVLALGPVFDLALRGQPRGWRLYARFAAAGAAANLLAYAVKFATLQLGWSDAGGRQFLNFGMLAPVSFILCGAAAGLISAAVFFRLRVADDLRRN